MRVQLIQKNINQKDFVKYLKMAEDSGADFACLGELSTSGCRYNVKEVEDFESILEKLSQINIPVMVGFPHFRDNNLYNSYIYYESGAYQIYDKINLFESMKESKIYKSGKEIKLFDTVIGKIGVLICYDLRFPELFKKLSDMGAKIIFVRAAYPRERIDDWKRLLVERAVENNIYICGINAVGDDGKNEFGGTTMAISPSGKIIAKADEINEKNVEVDL